MPVSCGGKVALMPTRKAVAPSECPWGKAAISGRGFGNLGLHVSGDLARPVQRGVWGGTQGGGYSSHSGASQSVCRGSLA